MNRSELWNDAQAAAFIGVSRGTLANWRCTKREIIPYIKIGSRVRYRPADVERWLDHQTVGATITVCT